MTQRLQFINHFIVKIRKIKESDLNQRVSWMNDPAVYSSMSYTYPITMESTIEWYDRLKKDKSRIDLVFEKEGVSVAMGGITNIEDTNNRGEIYIFVNPMRHGEGIGYEAVRMLCDYGKNSLHINTLYLYVDHNNERAIKIYEKIGFIETLPMDGDEKIKDKFRLYYELKCI